MNWWHYLILANLYLAMFYGFYLLLLRKETYFMLNRVYLVSAAILSFFIPLMQAGWIKNLFITQKVQRTIYYIDPGFVYQVSPPADSSFTVGQFFTSVYWLVAMLLFARLFYRFFVLSRLMQQNESGRAYSFFGQIKVDYQLPDYEVVYQHETIHAKHLHSADVLLFEILTILNWFNPVIYFYRKAIKHNHEFIADQNAVSFGVDKSDYALLLLSQTMGIEPNNLVNSFFNHSLLKQRIMMLHKNPSRRSALLKYGLSAPLFVAMLILTSATVSKQETIQKISDNISSDATIREVAVNLSPQINVVPVLPTKLNSPVIIVSPLKGKVVDVSGKPLAGVSVNYTKKHSGAITGKDGNFAIPNYEEGDVLTFNLKLKGYGTLTKSFGKTSANQPIIVRLGRKSAFIPQPNIDSIKFPKPISFANVEKLPMFPGGEKAFGKYMANSIHYPKIAKESRMQGRVIITFVVETNGSLTGIKVLRDIGGGCGEEAIRVLSLSPAWNPGMQDGKPVRVAFTMPVNFTLADGTSDSAKKPVSSGATVTGYALPDSSKNRKGLRIDGNSHYTKALVIVDEEEVKGLNKLDKINPDDVASVTVLKDSPSIAKYGDKGKDGVILITTKKVKKQ